MRVGVFILLTKLKVPTSSEEGKFFLFFSPRIKTFSVEPSG